MFTDNGFKIFHCFLPSFKWPFNAWFDLYEHLRDGRINDFYMYIHWIYYITHVYVYLLINYGYAKNV